MKESHKYDDIIHMRRPISGKRARMSMIDRGAQFSPFAALVGYDAVIRETARQTDSEVELDENNKELLNRKLQYLLDHPEKRALFLYFQPDERKEGGSYREYSGGLKRLDPYQQHIVLRDGTQLLIEQIRDIEEMD